MLPALTAALRAHAGRGCMTLHSDWAKLTINTLRALHTSVPQRWSRNFKNLEQNPPSYSSSSSGHNYFSQSESAKPSRSLFTGPASDLETLQLYNGSKEYHRTISHFESLLPYGSSHSVGSALYGMDNRMVMEYLKALVASRQLEKLLTTLQSGSPKAPSFTELPEFRLKLDDTSGKPLRVAVNPNHRFLTFFSGLLKYTIVSLFCIAALSIVLERVSENLPKGLGLGGGRKVVAVTDVKTKLADVKGCEEVKQELQEIIAYLEDPSKFTRLGAKLPKGVLLAGSPGTGKTLLARAIAGEAKVPFIHASAAEFEEMFVGVGARRIRDLFATARKMAPVIIFIDEIDAVGSRRAFKDSSSARMTLNQLLVELDGFEKNEGVVVICATNSPEALDPALVRPGRLDKTIQVPLPDYQGRKEILEMYGSRVTLGSDVDLKALARLTTGMTGADLFNIINIAAVRASAEGKSFVSMKALELALDRVVVGLERRNPMSEEEKRCTAVHEAGHALAGWFTRGSNHVYKATIMPRGPTLGVTWHIPEADRYQRKRFEHEAELVVCMGGRAAEELLYGTENVTSGCSNDLRSATNLARSMVMALGMGMDGSHAPMYIDSQTYSELSNDLRHKVDVAVQKLLDNAYSRALAVLTEHRGALDALSEALLERETMTRDEIERVLNTYMASRVPPNEQGSVPQTSSGKAVGPSPLQKQPPPTSSPPSPPQTSSVQPSSSPSIEKQGKSVPSTL